MAKKKKIIITLSTVILVIVLYFLCAYIIPFASYSHAVKWGAKIENFEEYQSDFEKIAAFCIETKEEHPEISYFVLSKGRVFGSTGDELMDVNATEDLIQSYSHITTAFRDKDARLDTLYCEDGAVYFTTHNGTYSVIYSPDKRPSTMSGKTAKADTKRITKGWYHAVTP